MGLATWLATLVVECFLSVLWDSPHVTDADVRWKGNPRSQSGYPSSISSPLTCSPLALQVHEPSSAASSSRSSSSSSSTAESNPAARTSPHIPRARRSESSTSLQHLPRTGLIRLFPRASPFEGRDLRTATGESAERVIQRDPFTLDARRTFKL